MILERDDNASYDECFPRRCGGDPEIEDLEANLEAFSPQVRG